MWWLRECWNNKLAGVLAALGFEGRVELISAASLAFLSDCSNDGLILLDLRGAHEIEKHTYSIPGALLTFNVDLAALIRWIPPSSTVVMFAAETIAAHDGRLRPSGRRLKVYSLEGGLQAWCQAGLPIEPVALNDRRWVDNR
ncbi:MAG: rhodanese-like domain-containing protein [Candidatus Acidiferrales bacterium]